jgi:hypothetical protein
MIVKMFQPQFVPLVRDGRKKQTIRPRPNKPKYLPKVGQTISCRHWKGKPYRSIQLEIIKSVIVFVEFVEVTVLGVGMKESSYHLIGAPTHDEIAKADGFEHFAAMRFWFLKQHGFLPFKGILIRWK